MVDISQTAQVSAPLPQDRAPFRSSPPRTLGMPMKPARITQGVGSLILLGAGLWLAAMGDVRALGPLWLSGAGWVYVWMASHLDP